MRINWARYWYRPSLHPLFILLLPFSLLFGWITACRRFCYRRSIFKTENFLKPVIVVGNITVGGTGKTPFVLWLTQFLIAQGYRPGIVSRGVGGQRHHAPHRVSAQDSVACVGDEALLLLKNAACPIVIGINRSAAVKKLLAETDCNIVISDDGLQHYRMTRDMEIVLVDAQRRFGNQYLLPAGPLRESVQRLSNTTFTVVNGGDEQDVFRMQLLPAEIHAIAATVAPMTLSNFLHKKVHAVAAIGHPERFFASLTNAGFIIIPHIFPDHHLYSAADINFGDDLPILMTEKDAVKCITFATEKMWYLRVTSHLNAEFATALTAKLLKLKKNGEPEDDQAEQDFNACRNNQFTSAQHECSSSTDHQRR